MDIRRAEPPDCKLITCILPKGKARPVIQALKDELDNITANLTTGRGVGKISPLALRGVGEQTEKDILSVVVSTAETNTTTPTGGASATITHQMTNSLKGFLDNITATVTNDSRAGRRPN